MTAVSPGNGGNGGKEIRGPLQDIRVLELATNIVGPLCSQILGDAGADVIKVEMPSGDQCRMMGPSETPRMGTMFLGLNRNKRSVVLDIKTAEGRKAFFHLLDRADVFIHSMRPSAIERLGLDYAKIGPKYPRLIYGYGPGYYSEGPYRDRAAYDDTIQGHAGIAGAIGRANGEFRYIPTPIADKLCGNILATAITMALYARLQTGRGQEVKVPMFENTVSFMLTDQMWGTSFDPPRGPIGSPRIFSPHRRPLRTQDGYLCLMVVTDDQWKRLFKVFGSPELFDSPKFSTLKQRMLNIDELYGIVADYIGKRRTDEWRRDLDAADVPNSPAIPFEDLPKDPYIVETKFFESYDHPTEGRLVRMPITVHLSDTPLTIRRPPPVLGADTEAVLKEAGYDADAIDDLAENASAAPAA